MEYQALPEFAQMHMLQEVMRMVLHAAMHFLALTIGCIACLCVCELRQPRPSRCRSRATPDEQERALAAWRLSTR